MSLQFLLNHYFSAHAQGVVHEMRAGQLVGSCGWDKAYYHRLTAINFDLPILNFFTILWRNPRTRKEGRGRKTVPAFFISEDQLGRCARKKIYDLRCEGKGIKSYLRYRGSVPIYLVLTSNGYCER